MMTMRLGICRKVGIRAIWATVLSSMCSVQSEAAFQSSLGSIERHMSDIGVVKARGP